MLLRRQLLRTMTTIQTNTVRSTAASGSGVYESERAVHEYLLFHYGDSNHPNLQMPYAFGPREALNFTQRTAQFCSTHFKEYQTSAPTRALDIGSAVGGSTFELSRYFDEVVGVDFSQKFVDAANEMKEKGSKDFEAMRQGNIFVSGVAKVPTDIDRSRSSFTQGDACNLSPSLGQFDIIHGSNLLCRLPSPRKFLKSVSSFLKPSGLLVLVSPYSWLEEYTPTPEWVGGVVVNGDVQPSFGVLKEFLEANGFEFLHQEDVPFLIREHERKFQYGVSDATVWKKK